MWIARNLPKIKTSCKIGIREIRAIRGQVSGTFSVLIFENPWKVISLNPIQDYDVFVSC